MPNYSVSVSSDDNMVIANESIKNCMTIEQFLKVEIKKIALNLKAQGKK
jgi:hypothetical protein